MPVTSRDGSRPQRGWHRAGHDGGVADPMPSGTYVVVSGPPGSGKTTLARQIAPAQALRWHALDRHALGAGLTPAPPALAPVPGEAVSHLGRQHQVGVGRGAAELAQVDLGALVEVSVV